MCIPSRTAWLFDFIGIRCRKLLPEDVFQDTPVSCVDFLHFHLEVLSTKRVTKLHQQGPVTSLVRDPGLLVLEILCRTFKQWICDTHNNTGADELKAFSSQTVKTVFSHRHPLREQSFGCFAARSAVLRSRLVLLALWDTLYFTHQLLKSYIENIHAWTVKCVSHKMKLIEKYRKILQQMKIKDTCLKLSVTVRV